MYTDFYIKYLKDDCYGFMLLVIARKNADFEEF